MIRKEKIPNNILCAALVVILSMAILTIGKKASDSKDAKIKLGYVDAEARQEKINQLKNALAANPRDSIALVGLGEAYFNMKNYKQAIEFFLRAEKLRPNDTNVKNKLGALYSRLSKLRQLNPKHF